jgi:hypothetical protein
LAGARLRVWDGVRFHEVEPAYAADDRLLAVLPPGLEHGALLIWPVRGGLVGEPFRINAATVWWCRVENFLVRLFGRNLSISQSPSRVWMAGENFEGWLEVVAASD